MAGIGAASDRLLRQGTQAQKLSGQHRESKNCHGRDESARKVQLDGPPVFDFSGRRVFLS
jgi:hypothetical protein